MSDQTTVPEAFTDLLDAPVAKMPTTGSDGAIDLGTSPHSHPNARKP